MSRRTLVSCLTEEPSAVYTGQHCVYREYNNDYTFLCQGLNDSQRPYIVNHLDPTIKLTINGKTVTMNRREGVNGSPAWENGHFVLFYMIHYDYQVPDGWTLCEYSNSVIEGDTDTFLDGAFTFVNTQNYDWGHVDINFNYYADNDNYSVEVILKSGKRAIVTVEHEKWRKIQNSGMGYAGIYVSPSSGTKYTAGYKCWSGIFRLFGQTWFNYNPTAPLYFIQQNNEDTYFLLGHNVNEDVITQCKLVNTSIQKKNDKLFLGVPYSTHYYESTEEMPQNVGDSITFRSHIQGSAEEEVKLTYMGYIMPRFNKFIQYLSEVPCFR